MVVWTFDTLVVLTCRVHLSLRQIDLCCLAMETMTKRSVEKAAQAVVVVMVLLMANMMIMMIILSVLMELY
jgi:hypothetical protein